LDIGLDLFGNFASYLSPELGLPENVTTTYVGAASEAGDEDPDIQTPGRLAVSGTVNWLHMDNQSGAWIGAGALVNQDPAYTLPTHEFVAGHFLDPAGLARKLATQADPVAAYLWGQMTAAEQASVTAAGATDAQQAEALASALDRIIALPDNGPGAPDGLYAVARLAGLTLSVETQALAAREDLTDEEQVRLNHLLVLDAYPDLVTDQSVSVESEAST